MFVFVFTKRCDDKLENLGLFIKIKSRILHQDIKFCEELVSGDLLHKVMDNRQWVLFAFHAFVERAEIRDLSYLAIFFGNNEARQGPL